METVLKLAIQKSGRLSEKSQGLLKEAGLKFNNYGQNLTTRVKNFPIEILFLRDDDIPGYVQDGTAHLGIIGENGLLEKGGDLPVTKRLDFARCRLSIAVPKTAQYSGVKDLDGKKIATSYPVILQNYLDQNGVKASIHEISGSVEIAPAIGLADAICDLVSTGSTLMSNGLKEVEVILESEAVLIANQNLNAEQQGILDQLLFRIEAVHTAQNFKYISLNAPKEAVEDITRILPGMKAPSVLPLATEGWVSVHTVVNENDFWQVVEKLREAGGSGILVSNIEKMIL